MPFPKLRNQPISAVILKNRQSTGSTSPVVDQKPDHEVYIEACAKDLIHAVHSRDIPAVAEALRSAFEILESMPHEEGEHTNEPNTVEKQNQIAAIKEKAKY